MSCSRRRALSLVGGMIFGRQTCRAASAEDPSRSASPSEALLSDKPYLYRLTQGEMARLRFAESPTSLTAVDVHDVDGRARPLPGPRGELRLISFWASWCAPCRIEVPSLERLQARLSGVDIIAVSIDKTAQMAARAYESWGVRRLALHHDEGAKAAAALRIEGVPMTLLIDPEGHEIGRLRGSAVWDSVEAILLMQAVSTRLMDVKAPGPTTAQE